MAIIVGVVLTISEGWFNYRWFREKHLLSSYTWSYLAQVVRLRFLWSRRVTVEIIMNHTCAHGSFYSFFSLNNRSGRLLGALLFLNVTPPLVEVTLGAGLNVDGDIVTAGSLTLSSLSCAPNSNGGALTTDASGMVTCSNDDGGSTLDGAYDQGGAGAGRTITADSGAVLIEGIGGLELDSGDLLQIPGNPVLVGSLGIGAEPNSVVVSGRYAYVVDSASDDLKVIDVSDPSAPSLVGSLGIGTFPVSVYVSGRYAYVTDPGGLRVIDVSDPSAPSLAGSLIFSQPVSVVVSGRYAYMIDGLNSDLKVFDVSDPSAPSPAGSLAIGANPNSVVVSGRYAYVVDQSSIDLKVIDVSDPSAPSLAGSLAIGAFPTSVVVSGRYAYVVDNESVDLKVIDVSDPSAPSLAGSLGIGTFPASVDVSGRYAYVIGFGASDLKVIDVSDPSAPSLAGSLVVGFEPFSMVVSGRYAYVVEQQSDELKVIDVSGAEVTSLIAHSLEAGNLQVRNDIIAQGQLQVTGGVNVGAGGVFSDGNVGISGTIAIADDIAPTSSPTNLVQLYAQSLGATSELKVRDEAGNITTLSPHNFSLIGKRSEPMAWSFFSENDHGKINVDMLRAMRLLESLSGERLVHTEINGSADNTTTGNVSVGLPEQVGNGSQSNKVTSYQKLIEAVTELKGENDSLKAQNEAMVSRLAALEKMLN